MYIEKADIPKSFNEIKYIFLSREYVCDYSNYYIEMYPFKDCKIATDKTKKWYIILILTAMKMKVSSNIIEKVGPRQETKKGKRTDRVVVDQVVTMIILFDNEIPFSQFFQAVTILF